MDGTYNYADWSVCLSSHCFHFASCSLIYSLSRENWAQTKSPNKDVKVYIGAPGSPKAATSGYAPIDMLQTDVEYAQDHFESFGGVMLWDAYEAYSESILMYIVIIVFNITFS